MAIDDPLRVEIAYADTREQIVLALTVPSGCTVADAIALSGISQRCAGAASATAIVGIYGRVVPADTVLCHGDRIEIYRPLVADPKQVRRRRAAANR